MDSSTFLLLTACNKTNKINMMDFCPQTYTGSMLVAVNPYEILPIYRNTEIVEYRERKIGELPPHIFAIGDSSFHDMIMSKKNQCIVIRYAIYSFTSSKFLLCCIKNLNE